MSRRKPRHQKKTQATKAGSFVAPTMNAVNRSTGESRLADAITVFWMLTVFQTLLLILAAAAARWYFFANPHIERIGMLGELLYVTAALSASVSLLLMPLVLRLRKTAPPLPVVLVSVAICVLPIAGLLFRVGMG